MLSAKYRINRNSFSRILNKGRYLDDQGFSWRILENNNNHPRFGLILTKKNLKLATDRNTLRRRIYHLFSKYSQDLPVSADLILMVRSTLIKMNQQELEKTLQNSFQKINQHFQTHEQKK